MCLGDWCRLNLFSDANLAAAIRSDSAATEKKKEKAKEKEKNVRRVRSYVHFFLYLLWDRFF